ncbi:MAG TPA: lysophospholipase [Amycolatopsis sp.]|uniref:alpha/beta hydrolase n=1 Tax=Amycolatopsis sp. TaxID=37632 RepID=UPI002B4854F7|nr:lysophospholipase [Amycolatopsis sp.]HKS47341.1 lysophospholipase [Amycolatopsis sp.]
MTWDEPEGLAPRGTLIVLAGRGEQAEVYERFGRRLAADAYRVRAVADGDLETTTAAVKEIAAGAVSPKVLVGSDTGALRALWLRATGTVAADVLVLAGLPAPGREAPRSWENELNQRTSCPTHQAWISDRGRLTRGALTDARIPAELREIDLSAVRVPVLGVHGAADLISPFHAVRARYAQLPNAQLISIEGGKHDALNDATHRTAAARIVLFLEELRGDRSHLEAG